jgi:magnesium-transporting ATPase (P-type)
VAITVAIIIVVCVFYSTFCNAHIIPKGDGRFPQQLAIHALDGKKEERGVKVIRSGDERAFDIKELLVGEIVPCNGVFISGHNVRYDESGDTGESDAIKKVAYDKCITLREQTKQEGTDVHRFNAANAHTNCFTVSVSRSSKVTANMLLLLSVRRVSTVVS